MCNLDHNFYSVLAAGLTLTGKLSWISFVNHEGGETRQPEIICHNVKEDDGFKWSGFYKRV